MMIGDRHIGPNHPPYIIAELGVNHDGSVERALQMVDAAAEAKADAIKLQLFRAEMLMSRASRLAGYQAAAGEHDPVEMLRRLELSIEQVATVVQHAHEHGLHAIVTVFSLPLVDIATQLEWDAFKTASPDIIHRPLLEALMATGKPMIVSTGASTMEEVRRAAAWLAPASSRTAFLQCVSSYPTRDEDSSFGGIGALRDALGAVVGYSDHTPRIDSGAEAVQHGACILEKHLTWNRSAAGPDHAASLDPAQFTRFVSDARQRSTPVNNDPERTVDTRPFDRVKRVLDCERDVRTVSRQSICSARAIAKGERIEVADIVYKRPGTGIEPFRLAEVLGRTAARAIEADMPITPEDLS